MTTRMIAFATGSPSRSSWSGRRLARHRPVWQPCRGDRGAVEGVEGRIRRASLQGREELGERTFTAGQLVAWLEPPGGDHCEHEPPALEQQRPIDIGVARAHRFRDVREVEL